jgi:hypothetical protein
MIPRFLCCVQYFLLQGQEVKQQEKDKRKRQEKKKKGSNLW